MTDYLINNKSGNHPFIVLGLRYENPTTSLCLQLHALSARVQLIRPCAHSPTKTRFFCRDLLLAPKVQRAARPRRGAVRGWVPFTCLGANNERARHAMPPPAGRQRGAAQAAAANKGVCHVWEWLIRDSCALARSLPDRGNGSPGTGFLSTC
jgi:hypothetical protein